MSLGDRKPMPRCGKKYASEQAARDSKRGRTNPALRPERCSCGSWHLRAKAKSRDTGPSRDTRVMVYARDLEHCAGCGKPVRGGPYSVQHRVARGMGGTSRPEANSFSNLVLLCGDATSPGGCHLACEQRDEDMHGWGLWLDSWERPDLVPVAYALPGHRERQPFYLTEDGQRVAGPPAEVAA